MTIREQIIETARKWKGTPWKHNQAKQGLGIDCVQFARVVAESVGISQVVYNNYYRTPRKDSLLQVFETHPNFQRVETFDKGDVLVFRISGLPHHVAIATSQTTMIHADLRNGVVEHNIGNWKDRLVACYEVIV
ncbi:MAG: NlpC/P60 family protein [Xenococcus sp. (in: cyanobacteria)]